MFVRRSHERMRPMLVRCRHALAAPLVALMLVITLAPGALVAQGSATGTPPTSGVRGNAAGSPVYPWPAPTGDVDVLWQLDIPEGYEPGPSVVYGDALLNTATSEAFGSNLTVYDLRTGAFRWNYAASEPFSDPFVADGVVYLTDGPLVTALSLEDGEMRWERTLDDGEPARGNAPIAIVAANGMLYVNSNASLLALDAATGEQRWQRIFESYVVAAPILAGEVVVVASIPLDLAENEAERRLHGISTATGNEVWRWSFEGVDGAVVYEGGQGIVVLAHGEGDTAAYDILDAGQGRPAWDLPGDCEPATAPVLGDVVACSDGRLLDSATGEALPGEPLPEGWSPLGRVGDQLIVTDGARIVGWDIASGKALWSADITGAADGVLPVTISAGDGALALVTMAGAPGDGPSPLETIVLGTPGATSTPVATPAS
jgi:hypothetical protein